jgi:hypothetical protein
VQHAWGEFNAYKNFVGETTVWNEMESNIKIHLENMTYGSFDWNEWIKLAKGWEENFKMTVFRKP